MRLGIVPDTQSRITLLDLILICTCIDSGLFIIGFVGTMIVVVVSYSIIGIVG